MPNYKNQKNALLRSHRVSSDLVRSVDLQSPTRAQQSRFFFFPVLPSSHHESQMCDSLPVNAQSSEHRRKKQQSKVESLNPETFRDSDSPFHDLNSQADEADMIKR